MKCPQCGTINDDEYIFCVNCGKSIPGGSRSESTPETVRIFPRNPNITDDLSSVETEYIPARNFVPQTQSDIPLVPPAKKSKFVLLTALALFLLLLAGGATIAVYFLTKKESRVEVLPDHFGMFYLNKEKTRADELKKLDYSNSLDAKAKILGDDSLPKIDYLPEIILFAEGSDVPLGELKFVQIDTIQPDGKLGQIEFQTMPVEGRRAMKRLRFPQNLANGKYAFAVFNGFFDEGKHRFWPFQIDRSERANNADVLRETIVAVKSKDPNADPSPTPSPNSSPIPNLTITAPVGSTVAFCNSTDVIVRGGPGLNARKLSMLRKGQKVFVIKYSENSDMWKGVEANWAYIQTETGKRGWVFTPFITK
ncbi:MAG: SH3 domain-containing protein [Saprospiraceae bacterium]|nr:SH3 domain-containing protein [Pyrinomonadaceae bacterium]